MEGCCTDESSTIIDYSQSITILNTDLLLSPTSISPKSSSPGSLSRAGSGSVVVDSVDVSQFLNLKAVEEPKDKLPSSKFKGVVPQPNKRWGSQIYEKHQRVWLGTFDGEEEAAKVYDVAVQRFRGRDAVTNFKPFEVDSFELKFLNSRSKAEVVDMLRKHTYDDELMQSKRRSNRNDGTGYLGSNNGLGWASDIHRELLFEKTVTPSDVGKLNRLVIPKHYAEKNFPLRATHINGNYQGNCMNSTASKDSSKRGMLLNFEDVNGKMWRFKYSYWNSSQSYVLTKGWNRLVKEKNLKAGDIVSFWRSTGGCCTSTSGNGSSTGSDKRLYIDWRPSAGKTTTAAAAAAAAASGCSTGQVVHDPIKTASLRLRLFGVDICVIDPINSTSRITKKSRHEIRSIAEEKDNLLCCTGKRNREPIELFQSGSFCSRRKVY